MTSKSFIAELNQEILITRNPKGWIVGDVLQWSLGPGKYVVIATFDGMAVLAYVPPFQQDYSQQFEKVL